VGNYGRNGGEKIWEIVEISDKEKTGHWDGMGWDGPSQAKRKRRIKRATETVNDGNTNSMDNFNNGWHQMEIDNVTYEDYDTWLIDWFENEHEVTDVQIDN
jgi:hypothetical protein